MTTLATYKTASGNNIALTKGSGASNCIEVTANKKFIGMFLGLQEHAFHGTVITLVGLPAVVQVPSEYVAAINEAVKSAKDIDAAKKQQALEKIAAYANTSEGRIEAYLSRMHAADDDGRDRAERF